MRNFKDIALASAVIGLIMVSQANALGAFYGKPRTGGGQNSHSAPAPVIGLGLPAAVAAGGVFWFFRRSRKAKDRK